MAESVKLASRRSPIPARSSSSASPATSRIGWWSRASITSRQPTCCRTSSASVGVARKGMSNDELRDSLMKRPARIRHPPGRRRCRPAAAGHASPASRPIRRIRPRSTAMRQTARQARGRAEIPAATACSISRRRPTRSCRSAGNSAVPACCANNGAWRRLVIEKPFGTDLAFGEGAERRPAETRRLNSRSTGSITISARKRSRTSWCCASPTACSSRSGTATTSITSRSPSTRNSASAIAAASTTPPARCATWCRTICFSCCRWSRWSRRSRFDAHSVRSEKAEVLAAIQTQSEAEALQNSVRGQYRGGRIGDTEIEDYRKTDGRQPGQHHRNLRRAETDHRQLALGRRAVLSAHRQGARRQAHRRSRSSSSRRRSRCSATRRWTGCRRTIW